MRCFTDAELRRGIIAVVLEKDGAADLFAVFLLAAVTPETQEITNEASQRILARSDPPVDPDPEATRRRMG